VGGTVTGSQPSNVYLFRRQRLRKHRRGVDLEPEDRRSADSGPCQLAPVRGPDQRQHLPVCLDVGAGIWRIQLSGNP